MSEVMLRNDEKNFHIPVDDQVAERFHSELYLDGLDGTVIMTGDSQLTGTTTQLKT